MLKYPRIILSFHPRILLFFWLYAALQHLPVLLLPLLFIDLFIEGATQTLTRAYSLHAAFNVTFFIYLYFIGIHLLAQQTTVDMPQDLIIKQHRQVEIL